MHVTVIDLTTSPPTPEPKTIPVGNSPAGIAITPDGKTALVTNWFNDEVTMI
jgi:DNA-binding beta-propeller fold protein YncE